MFKLPGFVFLLGIAASAAAADRPNILFVMADDHTQAATSCYGSQTIRTPNIDRLATDGLRFDRMVVTDSLCGPSRAVLLTGKYSHINGFRSNRDSFDRAQQTFPVLLQKAGYQTAIVGKWHLRTQPAGFDYYNVMPGQGRYFDCPLKQSGQPWTDGNRGGVVHKGYLTDVITDVALQWLKNRQADKPFLLMVHHKAPHGPHTPAPRHEGLFVGQTLPEPRTLLDDYTGRVPGLMPEKLDASRMLLCHYPEYRDEVQQAAQMDREAGTRFMYQTYMRDYLRLVVALDENIGRLLDYLDQSGLRDDTLVIYTSDNGFFNGEHGFFNKMWMYEPSLRLPLLVRWPGKVPPGAANAADLVSMLDVAPTLLDVAGAAPGEGMQGRSFKPLLLGPTPKDWRRSVYYHYYAQYNVPELYGVRTLRHKLIRYPEQDRWELFDLESDPQEMHNLADEPSQAALLRRLQGELQSLRQQYREP